MRVAVDGRRVREQRKEAGLTQAELASLAGVARETIRTLEHDGERSLRMVTASAIAFALAAASQGALGRFEHVAKTAEAVQAIAVASR